MSSIAIVGAGPGMGLAIARTFGSRGFGVALIARNRAKLDDMAGQLAAEGITAAAFPADVLDHDALTQALKDAAAHGQRPDGLGLLHPAGDDTGTPLRFPLVCRPRPILVQQSRRPIARDGGAPANGRGLHQPHHRQNLADVLGKAPALQTGPDRGIWLAGSRARTCPRSARQLPEGAIQAGSAPAPAASTVRSLTGPVPLRIPGGWGLTVVRARWEVGCGTAGSPGRWKAGRNCRR